MNNIKNRLSYFLNPISRIGNRQYSILFPLVTLLIGMVTLEFIRSSISSSLFGNIVITLSILSIIYFAFRDGVKAAFVSTVAIVGYYFYIIFSRSPVDQIASGLQLTITLGSVYLVLGVIIGWLKQTIDKLVEKEVESRQKAEDGQARIQTILQQLPAGVLTVDKKGKVTANDQLEKILGRRMPNHIQSNSQSASRENKVMLPKEWPIIRALKGEHVNYEEMEYVRPDGRKIFLRVSAGPIRNKKRQIIAAVSTLFDITQEKELEGRKDDFVNMASHELKTPITSIRLYLDSLVLRTKKEKDIKNLKTLKNIQYQTERLQELVNDLLDVSRIQTGKLSFNKEEFRLDSLVKNTLEELQGGIDKKVIYKGGPPTRLYADKFRVYQVLTNLITNADKYSPQGKEINVKVQRVNGKAIVSVKDYGIGVPKEKQNRIFDRLYQVSEDIKGTYPGLGMGLYISREIIKRHKGKIWVESKEGEGSTFYFSLPVRKVN